MGCLGSGRPGFQAGWTIILWLPGLKLESLSIGIANSIKLYWRCRRTNRGNQEMPAFFQ